MQKVLPITRFLFWMECVLKFTQILPVWSLFWVTNPLRKKVYYESICITDLSRSPDTDEFIKTITGSLDLVKCKDKKRFTRIRENIRHIVRMRMPSSARFLRVGRACLINDEKYPELPGPAMVLRLACTLVHESTHGYLLTKKIPYSTCKARHEEICTQEVLRFIKKY